ncbi:hypothetical protein KW785_02960 [Candidatus Parcubacteria bacterium]|nr:hypothetical protein [Candidatus Parcubacteria bacterium]
MERNALALFVSPADIICGKSERFSEAEFRVRYFSRQNGTSARRWIAILPNMNDRRPERVVEKVDEIIGVWSYQLSLMTHLVISLRVCDTPLIPVIGSFFPPKQVTYLYDPEALKFGLIEELANIGHLRARRWEWTSFGGLPYSLGMFADYFFLYGKMPLEPLEPRKRAESKCMDRVEQPICRPAANPWDYVVESEYAHSL